MDIKQALACPIGATVRVTAMIGSVMPGTTKNGKPWLSVTLQDKHQIVAMPIWDGVDEMQKLLLPGKVFDILCERQEYQGKPQFRYIRVETGVLNPRTEDYVPSYEISPEMLGQFQELLDSIPDPYRTLGNAFLVTRVWPDFLQCPAAVTHHGNKVGGLFLHTLGVMRIVDLVCNYLGLGAEVRGRLIFLAAIHDAMKVREYTWTPTIGKREGSLLNHRVLGVSFLERLNNDCSTKLSDEDLERCGYTLLCHHGQYGEYPAKSFEDRLLHYCDDVEAQYTNMAEAENGSIEES